jgi:hypothetical protein
MTVDTGLWLMPVQYESKACYPDSYRDAIKNFKRVGNVI